jgi:beta-galactosidase/beta-glucuronidase
MNTLRVWGGGIFLPDVWYDTCDEVGILVYHDMAYVSKRMRHPAEEGVCAQNACVMVSGAGWGWRAQAQSGHSPSADNTQDGELRHQIRRLSHHPVPLRWLCRSAAYGGGGGPP